MALLPNLIAFWKAIFRRRQAEADLKQELKAFIDELAERKVQEGLSEEAAQEAAWHETGGIEGLQEVVRRQRTARLRTTMSFVVVATLSFSCGLVTLGSAVRWGPSEYMDSLLGIVRATPALGRVPIPRRALYAMTSPYEAELRSSVLAGAIEGELIDRETGKPVSGDFVALRPISAAVTAKTDNNGHFRLSPPPCRYDILLGNTGMNLRLTNFVFNDPRTQSPMSLLSLETLNDPSMSVSVRTPDGSPQPGEYVARLPRSDWTVSEVPLFDPSESLLQIQVLSRKP